MTPHPILIGLACLSLSSCAVAAVGAVGAASVAAVQDRTVGEAIDDATASNTIKAELLNKSGEKFAGVDVEVTGGLVLLSGRVNTPEDRVEAEGVAWRQPQIQDVANEIQIAAPGGFVSNVADEVITARVRTALVTSRTVKSYNFNIETYNGVVYLMGIARSPKELQHAAEKASVVGGVKQVVSYVEIRQPRSAALAPAAPAATPAPEPTNDGTSASYQDELDGSYRP
ncbi:MAG: BON domain-containing protein [Pseudomonadota bacterium]